RVRKPELREDRVDVALDRALRHDEVARDRGVAAPRRDLAEDLELARGEGAQRRALRAAALDDERLDDARVDHRAARCDVGERVGELPAARELRLQQVAAPGRASLEERERRRRVGLAAEEDDPHLGMEAPQYRRELVTAGGEAGLGEDDVGSLALDRREQRGLVLADGDELDLLG